MSTNNVHHAAATSRTRLEHALGALGSNDPAVCAAARDELVSLAADRMRALAHRMLAGSARVRRWEETDDVVQGALLRLYRALGAVAPNDAQHFLRLAALQVRRELVDLARRYRSPESFAANHETCVNEDRGAEQYVKSAPDRSTELPEQLAEWSRFHDVAASLPDEQRELFDMVWYLGMAQDEIARLLDCSSRTVRRRWEETKQRFATAFRGHPPM